MRLRSRNNSWFAVCLSVFAYLLILILATAFPGNNLKLDTEDNVLLNDGWFLVTENGDIPIELPYSFDVKKGDTYTIYRDLGNDLSQGSTFCIRTDHQTIVAKIDGNILYDSDYDNKGNVGNATGSYWNLIRVPTEYAGRRLVLTFRAENNIVKGRIDNIYYGSKSSNLFMIAKKYAPSFCFDIIIFLISISLNIVFLVYYKKMGLQSLKYFASFCFWVGIWFIAESQMLQFFIGNSFYITYSAYFAMPLFPLFFVNFLDKEVQFEYSAFSKIVTAVMLVDLVVVISLQLFGIVDLYTSSYFTVGLILLSMIGTLVLLNIEYFKFNNKKSKSHLIAFGFLFTFGVIEIFSYYTRLFRNTGIFFKIGIFIYMLHMMILQLKKLTTIIKNEKATEQLEKMAYEDYMTKVNNRAALFRDLSIILDDKFHKQISLIYLDINDLKTINDKYGHSCGDIAILSVANSLKKSFGGYGGVYRIGGDEFVAYLIDVNASEKERLVDKFVSLIYEENKKYDFELNVAVGTRNFELNESITIDEMLRKADEVMYTNKQFMKKRLE